MKQMLDHYFEQLCRRTKKIVENIINRESVPAIVQEVFLGRIQNEVHVDFHRWYLSITGNTRQILNTEHFFRQFKSRYALQGITNVYLDNLEQHKSEIINTLAVDPLNIYQRFFHQAQMTHGNGTTVNKDLISFFTKITHTVAPDKFSALDNPIKKLFQMRAESFFVAYCVVNESYKRWISENTDLLEVLRQQIQEIDPDNHMQVAILSDYKLIDMIFWWRANQSQNRR